MVMSLTPLKVGWLNEGFRGGLMVRGSNATGVVSRGAEWWSEVVGCGGGAAELGQSQRKVMTGGAHLSSGHREGRRRREVRRFLVREAAIGQGATNAQSARPSGRGPVGRGRAAGWGRKMEVGCGCAENRSWAQFK
jgi:hypothetical protein